MSRPLRTIAIVGGGFCGATLVSLLLRNPPAGPTRIVLLERGPRIARGVAYASRDYPYLLNVPASRMSADLDDPLEFLRFAQRRSRDAGPQDFLPRAWYGDYLEERLTVAQLSAPPGVRLDVVHSTATAIQRAARDAPLRVALADGPDLYADQVVLAIGNPPPAPFAPARLLDGHDAYVGDPWTAPARVGGRERVLLIGTGLTMVDVVTAATSAAGGGVFHAISRHGLIPPQQTAFRADAFPGDGTPVMLAAAPSPLRMLRAVRALARDAEAAGGDWREAIAFVRSVAPTLWQRMSEGDRRRFLRHARPYWDVHRHRLPAEALARITHLRRSARLQVHAGRIQSLQPVTDGIRVAWRPRGGTTNRELIVDRVVNCTGPDYDVTRSRDPLIRGLVRDGLMVPDGLGLGMRTGAHGAVVDAQGWHGPNLHYLGPMLRADHWEATAAAELAVHAARLAQYLARPV